MLDSTSQRLLEEFYARKRLTLEEVNVLTKNQTSEQTSPHVSVLFQHHFIKDWRGESLDEHGENVLLGYEIDLPGKAYIEATQETQEEKRNARFRDNLNTVLAVISLVISVLLALKQLCS